MTINLNLTNHFLIAMPAMDDSIFDGTVVFICEHTKDGAVGVVVNRPTNIKLSDLLDGVGMQLNKVSDMEGAVMYGGPVHEDRGFVVHSSSKEYSSMIKISDDMAFTTSRDVLEDVAIGHGPEKILVTVGYSGWGEGQLEDEISRNEWLTVKAKEDVIFDLPYEARYEAALNVLGISPLILSAKAGHA